MSNLGHIGEPPPVTPIQNPQAQPHFKPITMPTPAHEHVDQRKPNSLWRTGAHAFFKDQRAKRVGDILTVEVNVQDNATFTGSANRNRQASEKLAASNFLGLETKLEGFLPKGVNPSNLIGITSQPTTSGTGTVKRDEKMSVKVPATVVQTLPNGNLVVAGRQEIRIDHEVRDLQVHGIIRPSDISSKNTIDYQKMAEARISYGGRGMISEFQKPAWGQQIVNTLSPF